MITVKDITSALEHYKSPSHIAHQAATSTYFSLAQLLVNADPS